jgi:hypothetical protein
VKEKYHIKSEHDAVFHVTKPDGETFQFVESVEGLYNLDTAKHVKTTGVALVNTVALNKNSYGDYLRAKRARDLQVKIGQPSTKDFVKIVTSNQLPNCPVTKADIAAAEHIFGPDVGSLKGKTTRSNPPKVRDIIVPLPAKVMSRYRNITLCADVMFVNSIPMLVTVSRHLRFGTVEELPSRSVTNLVKALTRVTKVYKRAGFRVTLSLMDGEFEPLRGNLADANVTLNTTGQDEHVGDIERFIRTIKERMRATYNMLHFEWMPHRMIVEMPRAPYSG